VGPLEEIREVAQKAGFGPTRAGCSKKDV